MTAEADCPSCDTCGSIPCNGGCRNGEWAGEERHVCVDEDACRAVVNRQPAAPVTAEDLPARLAEAEARAEFAEGELSALREHCARWESEKARADKAEQERDEARQMFKLMCEQVGVFEGQLDLMTQMRDSEKARADGLMAERRP